MNTTIRPMDDSLSEYLRDESRSTGRADTISFPLCEEDIREIVKEEYAARHRITVQGGRTGLAAAAVPDGGHVLNLSRMNRIKAMHRGDDGTFFVTVEPGCVLSELKKALSSKKIPTAFFDEESKKVYGEFCSAPLQQFPPDPTESSATIGGMTACNASGARSYLYGPTRNWVEGLRLVLRDGDVLSLRRGQFRAEGRNLRLRTTGGQTLDIELPSYKMPDTKNASGYFAADNMDAVDLICGSDGTLGVLSEIELRLCPEPAVMWGVTCFFDSEDSAAAFVDNTRRDIGNLAALEFFDSRALALLRRQKRDVAAFSRLEDIPADIDCAVYTEIHCGDEKTAYSLLFAIGDIMKKCGADESRSWVARNAQDRDRLYFFRHATPESVNMTIDRRKKENPGLTKLGSDMSVPDAALCDVLHMYNADLSAANLEYVKFGHIGNNHLHVNILPRNMEEYKTGKQIFSRWAKKVTAMGGAVSAEHGVGKLKAGFLRVMYGEEGLAGMARVKRAFDPEGLFGTGNLFNPSDYTEAGK